MGHEVGIEKIATYLPMNVVGGADLCQKYNLGEEFLSTKIGVNKLFYSDADEFTSDMASWVLNKLFLTTKGLKDELEVLIVCTQTPDFQLPHTAAIVQKKCELPNSLATFDVSLGCSGFVYGLSIIESFMKANNFKKGVLITCDTYSKIMADGDAKTRPLFTDAATATLISSNPSYLAKFYTYGTCGSKYDKLILKRGDQQFLYMNGREIFDFCIKVIPEEILRCLKMNSLEISNISYFLFHQASKFILDKLADALNLENRSKVLTNIERYGNTVSSSIPFLLSDHHDAFKKNDHILLSGFGVGLSWANTILEKV